VSYQLTTAKVWDGSAWVPAVGGSSPWPTTVDGTVNSVNVTADASVHTKGAWTELIASTSAAGNLLLVMVQNQATNVGTEGLLDIAIGAGGAESIIVANAVGGQMGLNVNRNRNDLIFPVSIPAGSRIAGRLQNAIASRVAAVGIGIIDTGVAAPSSLDTIGANTAASRGTNLPSNDTYVELTASTSQAYQAIVMAPLGTGNNVTPTDTTYTLAKGASGSEVELGSARVHHSNVELCTYAFTQLPFIYFGNVPAGTRLAVKQVDGSVLRDVILYGVPY